MSTLFTPDLGTTSKPQVKNLDTSWDEIVSIEEVQKWVQQYDSDEKTVLEGLLLAARELLERSYNVTISRRSRTVYYSEFGCKVLLAFAPHVSISEVRIDGVATTDFKEYGFNKKILVFGSSGNHLEVDFVGGSTDNSLKQALLNQIKFMYDGEWDDEEKISPDVDKILMSYASIY